MICPDCDKAMDYASQNEQWWCNRCLAFRDGDAPPDAPPPSKGISHGNEADGAWLGTATESILDLGWVLLLGAGIAIGIYLAT
jgi:hypothetical protein